MTAAQYDKIIYDAAVNRGKLPPAVALQMVAQARHESANYSSNVFRNTNNSFGYKWVPPNGSALQSGKFQTGGLTYGTYRDVADSAVEVAHWLYRRERDGKLTVKYLTTPEAYADALKRSNYYENPYQEYLQGMKAALAKIDLKTAAIAGGSGLLIAGIIALIWWRSRKTKHKK